MSGDYYHERLQRNNKSLSAAEHHREEWSAEEIDFLMELFPECRGDAEQEESLAVMLGRTIEACRQRFYEVRAGRKGAGVRVKVTETKTTMTEYIGLYDDDEDRWWEVR